MFIPFGFASPIVRRFDRSVRCHLHIFFFLSFIFEKSRSHFNRGINLFPKISTPDLSDFSPILVLEKTPGLPNPQVAKGLVKPTKVKLERMLTVLVSMQLLTCSIIVRFQRVVKILAHHRCHL